MRSKVMNTVLSKYILITFDMNIVFIKHICTNFVYSRRVKVYYIRIDNMKTYNSVFFFKLSYCITYSIINYNIGYT